MKNIKVYTHYDESKTVIGHIRPRQDGSISKRTYNRLLAKRTVGGDAGIYTDASEPIKVIDEKWDCIITEI